jgi:methionyl aminopeptidase
MKLFKSFTRTVATAMREVKETASGSKQVPLLLTEAERDGIRKAARFNAQLMDYLRGFVKPGVTTNQLDRLVYEYTDSHGHIPACLGYKNPRLGYPPYPKSICTSVNDVVCHGIPDDRPLREGDIVNIDLTTIVEGWHGDQSETFLIGEVSDEARRLVQTTFECLWLGIEAIKPGGRINDIGRAIERHAYLNGFSVVREFQGHGVGREFHQEPSIPHFAQRGYRKRIEPGTVFTIEPMINAGTHETISESPDGWTVRTKDGKLSAQFEHSILMTESGPEVLTLTKLGPRKGHVF